MLLFQIQARIVTFTTSTTIKRIYLPPQSRLPGTVTSGSPWSRLPRRPNSVTCVQNLLLDHTCTVSISLRALPIYLAMDNLLWTIPEVQPAPKRAAITHLRGTQGSRIRRLQGLRHNRETWRPLRTELWTGLLRPRRWPQACHHVQVSARTRSAPSKLQQRRP
jgi:hypothetical protein